MTQTIKDIMYAYEKGEYNFTEPYPSYLSAGTVIDEDKSVKWNANEVEKRNRQITLDREAWRKRKYEVESKLSKDVVNYLINTWQFNTEQAEILERFVYEDKHSAMSDYFASIDEMAKLVRRIIRASN